jgi:hypothetical protein
MNKNGSQGNQTTSYATGVTGSVTDTANTDTVAAGDLICLQGSLGGSGQAYITFGSVITFLDATTDGQAFTGNLGSAGPGAGSTSYLQPGGRIFTQATESNSQVQPGTAATSSKLWCYVSSANAGTNPTIVFRKNGSNGNQLVTVTAGAAGAYQDTSNSDAFLATDLINYQLNGGSGGVTFTAISTLLAVSVPTLSYTLMGQAVF